MRTHKDEVKGLTLAHSFIFAFKCVPILADNGKDVIGTYTIMANDIDLGGSIPKWLIGNIKPKVMPEMFEDLMNAAREAKKH